MRQFGLRLVSPVVIAMLLVAGCSGGGSVDRSGPVRIVATPQTALMDVPVSMMVTGLRPGSTVTVGAEATDGDGTRWSSHVDTPADGKGTASLDRAPTTGSYSGAHPMGLLTTMTPESATGNPDFVVKGRPDFTITLRAAQDGKQLASTTLTRQTHVALGVRTQPLDPSTGLHGTLFLPADTSHRRPAVLSFGGSEGGEGAGADFSAALLAAHGYPALSLAYFHASGVPAALERIPLEYFARAAALLARQPGVDPAHVFAWGISRGGEAAMLLGVHYPGLVQGVIATSTSDHVFSGLPDRTAPAWTRHGTPLPFAGPADTATPGAPGTPASVIPVERIDGPLMTVCGAADTLIPSCPFAAAIAQRRGSRARQFGDVNLAYPRAGHAVGGLPVYDSTTRTTTEGRTATGVVLQLGGTNVDNAEDGGAARTRLLDLLAAQH